MKEIRLPPACLEAERAVISAVILAPDRLPEAREVLRGHEFHSDECNRLWDAVVAIADAGEPVDSVTVARHLQATGALASIGGTPTIAKILEASPAISHVGRHAEIVREAYLDRCTMWELEKAAGRIRHGQKSSVALNELREELKRIRE